jgi:hypothetical protein
VKEALRGERVDEYMLGRILGALAQGSETKEDMVRNWNVVWKERLALGPVDHDSMEMVLRYMGECLTTTADEGGFRIDFVYKEKPDEEKEEK